QQVATAWADALQEAKELTPLVSRVAVMPLTAAAKRTAALEREALTLVRQGHADAAHSVLSGPEYEAQRQFVVQGIQAFLDELRAQFNTIHRVQRTKFVWSFVATTVTLAAWL